MKEEDHHIVKSKKKSKISEQISMIEKNDYLASFKIYEVQVIKQ